MYKLNVAANKRSMAAYAAAETRRLYHFENTCPLLVKIGKQRAFSDIVKQAKKIWKNVFYHRNFQNFPEMRLGKGIMSNGKPWSYYDPNDHTIEFAPGQRDFNTLSHELVHANGRDFHDEEFIFQEFRIFTENFDIDVVKLSEQATIYNLSHQPYIH